MNQVGKRAVRLGRVRGARTLAAFLYGVALMAAVGAPLRADDNVATAYGSDANHTPLFNTISYRSDDISTFRKWTDMLERHRRETATELVCANGTACARTGRTTPWRAIIDDLRTYRGKAQLEATQAIFNRVSYEDDDRNFGVNDYWASPGEFLARGGDCEDYAIAKFLALIELGWPKDQVRLVALNDVAEKVAHAVVVVYLPDGPWVLDSRRKRLELAKNFTDYRPLFSLTERAWWYHVALGNAS